MNNENLINTINGIFDIAASTDGEYDREKDLRTRAYIIGELDRLAKIEDRALKVVAAYKVHESEDIDPRLAFELSELTALASGSGDGR